MSFLCSAPSHGSHLMQNKRWRAYSTYVGTDISIFTFHLFHGRWSSNVYHHVPALGRLHWLFPLPEIHFSQISTQLPPHLLSCCCCSVPVRLFSTPWTAAHQASLSFTTSQSLLKLMSIESTMSSNHLALCPLPLLLLPSIPSFLVLLKYHLFREGFLDPSFKIPL